MIKLFDIFSIYHVEIMNTPTVCHDTYEHPWVPPSLPPPYRAGGKPSDDEWHVIERDLLHRREWRRD